MSTLSQTPWWVGNSVSLSTRWVPLCFPALSCSGWGQELSLSSARHGCPRRCGPQLALPRSLQFGAGLRLPLLCTTTSLTASAIHFPGRGRDKQYLAGCGLPLALQCTLPLSPSASGAAAQPFAGEHSAGLIAAHGLFQALKFRSKFMLPAPLVESLSVGSHQTGDQHGCVWGLRAPSGMGNNSANRSQAAGVCMGVHVAGKYLRGSKLGGARRQREQPAWVSEGKIADIGGEGAHTHLSGAVRKYQISAPGRGLLPTPQSIFCT